MTGKPRADQAATTARAITPTVTPPADLTSPPRRVTDLPPAQIAVGDLIEHPDRPGSLLSVSAAPRTVAGRVEVAVTGATPLSLDPAVLVRVAVNRTMYPEGAP